MNGLHNDLLTVARIDGLQAVAPADPEHYQEPPQAYRRFEPTSDFIERPGGQNHNFAGGDSIVPEKPQSASIDQGHLTSTFPGKAQSKPRGLWSPSKNLLIFLIALLFIIIIAAVLGGVLGSVLHKKNSDTSQSQSSGPIKSVTVVQSLTLSHPTSQPASSSAQTPTITLGPSETYSKISSPTLTLSRDCPSSNGTTVITNDVPPQRFVKNCNWIYRPTDGNIFDAVVSTLDACIGLCAAWNVVNGTGDLGNCTDVAWRTDMGQEWPGRCWGNIGGQSGLGQSTSDSNGNVPADSAFLVTDDLTSK